MGFLGWTFIWKKQIRNISYQFGCGTQPLRSCFQFWNWKKSTIKRSKLKSKVFSRLIRVRRIRWAIQFFPPNNFGIFPKLKLCTPNINVYKVLKWFELILFWHFNIDISNLTFWRPFRFIVVVWPVSLNQEKIGKASWENKMIPFSDR